MTTIIGFLRGINVGGHHKVPMSVLRDKLLAIECRNVRTLLNSGNVVFEANPSDIHELETRLETHLSESFGFPIPVLLRERQELVDLVNQNPFANIPEHPHIKCYVTFLKQPPDRALILPHHTDDQTHTLLSVSDTTILSALDLSKTSTPKGMDQLAKLFGKQITTRTWNTIVNVIAL
jgi:uncharacterized protein (DUF1697 family)